MAKNKALGRAVTPKLDAYHAKKFGKSGIKAHGWKKPPKASGNLAPGSKPARVKSRRNK